jgi:hypothetical protein
MTSMKSYPDEQTWTVDDINNQRRISDEIEKSIHRMHMRMLAVMLAIGAALAATIHFLSTP